MFTVLAEHYVRLEMLSEEKVAPCFVRQLKPFPEVRVENMKT